MKKFFPVLLVLFFLCSCSDYNELNMQALVSRVGVDFRDGKCRVTVMYDSAQERKEGKGDGGSFFDAVREMSGKVPQKLYWGHAKTIVFGENSLSNLYSGTLSAALRARDVYMDIVPVVAKGARAEDIMKLSDADLFGVFANEDNSRRFHALPLWKALLEEELFGVYVLPVAEKDGESALLSGGAVMRNGKFKGYLSGDEMLFRSLLTDRSPGGYLPKLVAGDGKSASFEILANELEFLHDRDKTKIVQKITLSPSEVLGDMTEDEMRTVVQEYLSEGYRRLFIRSEREGFGNLFMLKGGDEIPSVSTTVRISNILGGK